MSKLEAFVILNEDGTLSATWRRPFRVRLLPYFFSLPGIDKDLAGVIFEDGPKYNLLASHFGLDLDGEKLFGKYMLGRFQKDGLLHGLEVHEIRHMIVSFNYVWDENSGAYVPQTNDKETFFS